MPTRDKEKNLEYVKKSLAKKKIALGVEKYNKINADTEQKHRDKLKTKIGETEYKKKQAEYMKEYRAKQKRLKEDIQKKQKSSDLITNAIKARNARKELQRLAIEKANKTADKLKEIGKTAKEITSEGRTLRSRNNN